MTAKSDSENDLPQLEPRTDSADAAAADAEVKGGALLSASALTSASVLKQSSQLSTSVDPGKVQGFECNGRA